MIRKVALVACLLVARNVAAEDVKARMEEAAGLVAIWTQDKDTHAWRLSDLKAAGVQNGEPQCQDVINRIADAPASTTVAVAHDTPEFKAGKVTLGQLKKTCAHIATAYRLQQVEDAIEAAMPAWVNLMADEAIQYGPFKSCIDSYDAAIKDGMSPTELVPERTLTHPTTHKPYPWKGTIEDLKKGWCDEGMKKYEVLNNQRNAAVNESTEDREARLKKFLKADKLRIAVSSGEDFVLAGGRDPSGTAELASATVWFMALGPSTADTRVCKGDKKFNTLRRYQFNAAHKLVKSTEKEYCGPVPDSAYR